MKEIFIKTIKDEHLIKLDEIKNGCWINLESPDRIELDEISEKLKIPKDWVNSCIDLDEKSRIEREDGNILMIIRIPFKNQRDQIETLPIGIITTKNVILTISLYSNNVINDIKTEKIKIYTTQRTRFILKIFERTNIDFDRRIIELEKKAENIEKLLTYSLTNREIYELLIIQKALIYFSSAIVSNEGVFERINTGKILELYEADKDLIDDIIISNRQIYESIKILRDVLSSTLDAYASIISNNLNIVMKFLTSVGIIVSVPVLIASLYGMNVKLPLSNLSHAFLIIVLISFFVSITLYLLFKKKGWV